MSKKNSLLELIKENISNGELPDTFSLPKANEDDPNKIKWADGALDGCLIYHTSHPEISDEQMKIIADAFSSLGDNDKAKAKFKDFFAKISPIVGIDAIQNYIFDHTDTLDGKAVYLFAGDCLYSSDADLVKLGMLLIEVFNEPKDIVKDIIRTLGLSDEFSIFAIFNMMTWQNSNQEIFELAKKVHSWGRIHAVKRLNPETQEIKDWLLADGINNNVISSYSALDVYQKVGIDALLRNSVNDDQIVQIAKVLDSMFEEGPVIGISALSESNAKTMLSDFITQAENHTISLEIANVLLTISEDKRFAELSDKCLELLNSQQCRNMIENELENGRAINLAKAIDIPYKEKIFAHMKSDFEKGSGNCGTLLGDEAYREKVIEVFRTSLPLKSMVGTPATAGGYSEKYANYNKLSFLIQFLKEYPLCGTDIVAVALKMPVVQCRIQALNAITEWCKVKKCNVQALSDELFQAVEYLKQAEIDERVKEIITKNSL